MKLLPLIAGSLSVALIATPAAARHHYRHHYVHHYRHHAMVHHYRHHAMMHHAMAMHRARYRVGYVFGPDYGYTAYNALPQPYVVRYHLSPDYRYVYTGNTVYVVDPTTYAITRILNGIPR
jgi:hypothetical protein